MTAVEPSVTSTGRYSVIQTAKVLEMHRNTIYKKIKEGYIKVAFRKDTMKVFIKGSEILRYWKSEL